MQSKGQLFATDFLIAMTIVILGFGIIGAISEYNMYQNKEQTNYKELQEKAETAAITVANASWADCNFGTTEVAYSINTDKINSNIFDFTELKKRLGVSDYNFQITLNTIPLNAFQNDALNTKNIVGIDLNVLWCNNTATFSDLNTCMKGPSDCLGGKIERRTLTIKVGK